MTLNDIVNKILSIIKKDKYVIFFIDGDLGVGKTFLVKEVAKRLGIKEKVTSPTFVVLKIYRWGKSQLVHIDLYRMMEDNMNVEEVLNQISFWDYVGNSLMFVEWGGVIIDDLKDLDVNAFLITINKLDNTNQREYTLKKL